MGVTGVHGGWCQAVWRECRGGLPVHRGLHSQGGGRDVLCQCSSLAYCFML